MDGNGLWTSLHAFRVMPCRHDVQEYLSQAQRTLNNIEDGFYISPAFLDKLSIHVAKNFLDLPKIKVPLILGEQPCTKSLHICNTPHHFVAHGTSAFDSHFTGVDVLLRRQVSGVARARARPSNATWPSRSWTSLPL